MKKNTEKAGWSVQMLRMKKKCNCVCVENDEKNF